MKNKGFIVAMVVIVILLVVAGVYAFSKYKPSTTVSEKTSGEEVKSNGLGSLLGGFNILGLVGA